MEQKPTVIVYWNELPEVSEQIIRAEADALDQFRPFFVGMRPGPQPGRPQSQAHVIGGAGLLGSLQRGRFKIMGPSRSMQTTLGNTRPSLIQAHFGPDIADSMSIADALKVPLVMVVHDYDSIMEECRQSDAFRRSYERLKKTAACFLCATEYVRERLEDNGFPAEKLQVHFTGVDTQYFSADPKIERSPIVLLMGQISPDSGVENLIRAMYQVEAVVPGAKLVILGDGLLRPKLQAFAQKYGRNIELPGTQGPDAVREWMNRASVFCTLGTTTASAENESLGALLAKSQSMGLPVVGFASGGNSEIVAAEETGYLVKRGDWEALATSMLTLLLSPAKWVQFSRAGQLRAKKLFDVRKQALALECVYRGVIAERSYGASQKPPRSGSGGSLPAARMSPNELLLSA